MEINVDGEFQMDW